MSKDEGFFELEENKCSLGTVVTLLPISGLASYTLVTTGAIMLFGGSANNNDLKLIQIELGV